MKIKHTKKLSFLRYCPDDKEEPALGAVVEVENETVANLLVNRGWGEPVADAPEAKPEPKSKPKKGEEKTE